MYAAPNKAASVTKTTRDANYPPATSKPLTKLVQYKRDKSIQAAAGGMLPSAEATEDECGTPANTAEEVATTKEGATGPSADGPYLAPATRPGAWSVSKLFAHKAQLQRSHEDRGNEDTKDIRAKEPTDVPVLACKPGEHPLQFAWSFWFMHRAPGYKIDDYEAAMIKIATFASVESFWAVYSHLRRADQVPTITDYHMFRAGVRPVWEDSANVSGGKWMIRLRKGVSPRIWEKLAMAVVGDAFDVGDEICGIVLSIRNSEDIISLWNKTAIDHRTNSHIRDTMRQSMELPTDCIIQYKVHNDSLRDSSTFKASESFK